MERRRRAQRRARAAGHLPPSLPPAPFPLAFGGRSFPSPFTLTMPVNGDPMRLSYVVRRSPLSRPASTGPAYDMGQRGKDGPSARVAAGGAAGATPYERRARGVGPRTPPCAAPPSPCADTRRSNTMVPCMLHISNSAPRWSRRCSSAARKSSNASAPQ